MNIEKISKCSTYGAVTLAWLIMGILSTPGNIYGFNSSSALVEVSGQLCPEGQYEDCFDIGEAVGIGSSYKSSTGSLTLTSISASGSAYVDNSGFQTYTRINKNSGYEPYGSVSADAGYQMGLYVLDQYSNADTTLILSYDLHGSLSITDPTASASAGVGVQMWPLVNDGTGYYAPGTMDSYWDALSNPSGGSVYNKEVDINNGALAVGVPVNEWFFLKTYLVSSSQFEDGDPGNSNTLISDFDNTLSLNSLQAGGRTIYSTDVDLFGIPDLQQGTWGQQVPIPSAVWLLGAGLVGLVGIRRKFKN